MARATIHLETQLSARDVEGLADVVYPWDDQAAAISSGSLRVEGMIIVPCSMSELSCIAALSHPRDTRLGSVGKLLPGLECKIAEDGEFLVRGPLVMKGYRKEPAKTAEAIDADGWLHTGDILDADSDGYLRMVDRKKELIINASGKNM